MNPITYVRIDLRCPQSEKDNILIIPSDRKMVRCHCCLRWYSLDELRQLRTEIFAPLMPGTRRPYEGYKGAIKETAVEKNSQIDWLMTSDFDNSDEKGSR